MQVAANLTDQTLEGDARLLLHNVVPQRVVEDRELDNVLRKIERIVALAGERRRLLGRVTRLDLGGVARRRRILVARRVVVERLARALQRTLGPTQALLDLLLRESGEQRARAHRLRFVQTVVVAVDGEIGHVRRARARLGHRLLGAQEVAGVARVRRVVGNGHLQRHAAVAVGVRPGVVLAREAALDADAFDARAR